MRVRLVLNIQQLHGQDETEWLWVGTLARGSGVINLKIWIIMKLSSHVYAPFPFPLWPRQLNLLYFARFLAAAISVWNLKHHTWLTIRVIFLSFLICSASDFHNQRNRAHTTALFLAFAFLFNFWSLIDGFLPTKSYL